MIKEEKDLSKSMEWKGFEEAVSKESGDEVVAKRRVRKRIREIPEHYFLPRRSLSSNLLIYGACIAGGIGAGMLVELWINKKVKEDGGVIWESGK